MVLQKRLGLLNPNMRGFYGMALRRSSNGACWRLPSCSSARPAGDPLQIMAEHAPADGTGRPVLKAFGTPDARASVVFEDRHARFCRERRFTPSSFAFVRTGLFVKALFQACGIHAALIADRSCSIGDRMRMTIAGAPQHCVRNSSARTA